MLMLWYLLNDYDNIIIKLNDNYTVSYFLM